MPFAGAFNMVVKRHPILRTAFVDGPNAPLQKLLESWHLPVLIEDLTSLPVGEQAAAQNKIYQETLGSPFALHEGMLFRINILKLTTTSFTIILNFHHIVVDGGSMGILVKELASLYRNKIEGCDNPQMEPPLPYSNFAIEQRKTDWRPIVEKWLHYLNLADEAPVLTLSNYHLHPKTRHDKGGKIQKRIEGDLFELLHNAAKRSHCTTATILFALFNSLLSIYSGNSKIYVGFPAANRRSTEYLSSIGFFVNTLVLKTEFNTETTFKEVVSQVKAGLLFALENQSLPFQQLLHALNLPRLEGISPLFQAMFVMQNAPSKIEGFDRLEITIDELSGYPVLYDLVLEVAECEKKIDLKFEYKIDCLPEQIVQEFSDNYLNLMSRVLNNMDSPIQAINFIEHPFLPALDNSETIQTDCELLLFDLIEIQAKKDPEAIAYRVEGRSFTYDEMIKTAYQTAYHLTRLGVEAEEPIGCLLDRSQYFLPNLLGIFKSGCSYVPLDPNFPPDRLKQMIETANISKLIVDPKYVNSADFFTGLKINPQEIPYGNPVALQGCRKSHLAYILFTSGSTGIPKGVMVEHGSLLSFTQCGSKLFQMTPSDRSLQFASLNWDTSSEEIFPCLATRGTVVSEAMKWSSHFKNS